MKDVLLELQGTLCEITLQGVAHSFTGILSYDDAIECWKLRDTLRPNPEYYFNWALVAVVSPKPEAT